MLKRGSDKFKQIIDTALQKFCYPPNTVNAVNYGFCESLLLR